MRVIYTCFFFYSGALGLDSVIQRNDTSKSSTVPEVVYPMRTAESHGAASNAAVDRKTVPGSVSSAAAAGGTAIGQSLFYTDFPPKEYGHSAGRWSCNHSGTYILITPCTSEHTTPFVPNPQDRCPLSYGTPFCIVCWFRFFCTATERVTCRAIQLFATFIQVLKWRVYLYTQISNFIYVNIFMIYENQIASHEHHTICSLYIYWYSQLLTYEKSYFIWYCVRTTCHLHCFANIRPTHINTSRMDKTSGYLHPNRCILSYCFFVILILNISN